MSDGGKVYLYVGNSPVPGFYKTILKLRGNRVEEAVCLELEADMKTVRGGEHPIVPGPALAKGTEYEGHAFFEASSIRRIGEKYYFVYSSELSHELCYAVSDLPTGGFRYGGTLISIADLGYKGNQTPLNYTGNTHGGMAELNGGWYIFYHRQTNRIKCSRQACAEKLTILPDGSIPQVEVTSCGLNGGPLSGKGRYEARIACNLSGRNGMIKSDNARRKDKKKLLPYFTQSGEDREADGDQYIANMQDGSWCGFRYFRFDGDEREIRITVRGNAEGSMKVRVDREQLPVAAIRLHSSEKWQNYSSAFSVHSGKNPLYFTYEGKGSLDFQAFEIK